MNPISGHNRDASSSAYGHELNRRGRAQWLSVERTHGGESLLPKPLPEASAAAKAERFSTAASLLRAIEAEALAKEDASDASANSTEREKEETVDIRHLTVISNDETGWNEPVDWSDCVESADPTEAPTVDLTQTQPDKDFDLRQREIELRDGRLLVEENQRIDDVGYGRLYQIAAKRMEELAWKQLENSQRNI